MISQWIPTRTHLLPLSTVQTLGSLGLIVRALTLSAFLALDLEISWARVIARFAEIA